MSLSYGLLTLLFIVVDRIKQLFRPYPWLKGSDLSSSAQHLFQPRS